MYKIHRCQLIALAIAVFVPALQAETWSGLKERLLAMYQTKHYSESLALAEKAVIAAKSEFGTESREYAQSLDDLAALYRVQSKSLQKESQAIRQRLGITGSILGISTEVFFDEVDERRIDNATNQGQQPQEGAQQLAPADAKQRLR